jgi:hypothetical protein
VRARLAASALALVLAGAGAGCGNGHSERHAVSRYVDDVNSIEVELRRPLTTLAKTNRAFSRKDAKRTQARATRARRTLLTLDRKLHALDPPDAALVLHRRLIALVDAEVAIAREVEQLAQFLPRLDAAVAPVPATQRKLNAALHAAHTPVAQADALDAYARALEGPLRALRSLTSPPVTAPVLAGEVQTLSRVSASARALAGALRKGDLARVPQLQRRFLVAARSSDTVSAQRARIAAVRSYNRRVRSLGTLAARVQRERDRLQRSLD